MVGPHISFGTIFGEQEMVGRFPSSENSRLGTHIVAGRCFDLKLARNNKISFCKVFGSSLHATCIFRFPGVGVEQEGKNGVVGGFICV
jgi:hypothetical protein